MIVTENGGGTFVEENGSGPIGTVDNYNVRLGQAPTSTVYVTITAEPDNLLNRLGDNATSQTGDSILLTTGSTPPAACTSTATCAFYQHTTYDGASLDVPQRAVVLVFTPTNWMVPQQVWVGAINDALPDGTRVYEVSHSVLSADPFFDNAVVRNVEVTKIDTGTPGILISNLGNSDTPGIYFDGVGNGTNTFTSVTATFVASDVGQPIVQTGGSLIPAGTTIATFVNATTVTLSHTVATGTAITFSLPSRMVPPADFTDGVGSGTTFTSATASFTLGDLGQPVVGAGIAAGTVIIAVNSLTSVTLSNSVSGSGLAFELPSRLAGFPSFRDGVVTGGGSTITSVTGAFNAGDVGRPIVETDGLGFIQPGTVILSTAFTGTTTQATLSKPILGSGTHTIDFALPARNAANTLLEGSATTGVTDYIEVSLAAQPTGNVTLDINGNGTGTLDYYVSLASGDSRFCVVLSACAGPFGTTPGSYTLTFSPTNWNVPVVIAVSSAPLESRFDPHNTFITAVVDPALTAAPEYVTTPAISTLNSPLVVQVLSSQEAGGLVQAPAGMVVTKCGNLICTIPGTGSSYSLRLTEAPTAAVSPASASQVTVALVTDGQTDIPVGGRVSLGAIGAPNGVALFTGNVTISGNTITLTPDQLSSFITEGFQIGQRLLVQGTGADDNTAATPYTITGVTANQLMLGTSLAAFTGCTGSASCVTLSRVVNQGLATVAVNYNSCAVMVGGNCIGTLTRVDGSSWLDDGFLEGQLIQINGGSNLYKIQALTGTTSTKVDVLAVTAAVFNATTGAESVATLPFSGTGTTTVTLREWSAEVTFTGPVVNGGGTVTNAGNWFVPVSIPVVADPYYNVPAGNTHLLEFPKVPHLLSSIEGPLSVEGGPTGNEHATLNMAVMLPGESNGLPFGIGIQPPEAQQVNVLNIFDDGSQQDQTGTLSSTTLTGFGMGPGLNFTNHKGYVPGDLRHPTFGEPPIFPSGISFGAVTVDGQGNVQTNVSLSSVQVLNLMMGQGNDHLSVTGSLVPGPFANDDGTPCFNTDGTPCTFVQGGLTLVQGGGAEPLAVPGPFTIAAIPGGYTVTRTDGLAWSSFEFTVGQELLWGASPYGSITTGTPFGTITAITGNVLTVTGSGLPATGSNIAGTIGVFAPIVTSTGSFNIAGSTITRNDLLSWQQFGFAVGQQITVDGVLAGTITGFSGPSNDVLSVTGPLAATACAATGAGQCTVAAFNAAQNQVAIGGNQITVTGGGGPGPGLEPTKTTANITETATTITRTDTGSWLTDGFVYGMVVEVNGSPVGTVSAVTASTLTLSGATLTPGTVTGATVLGFAPSPLAVYGSTSQDGIWYSGDPHTLSQRDFGLKPFPTQIGNGSPDFIFPVADPFVHAGNNVIDASQDFAAVPEGQVPSVGLILYGGPGNNTILGSQAPDFIAGGSGNTTVYGERGDNQLLGNDGINVDVITRAISFPTVNTSVFPDADQLLCTQSPAPHCNNLVYGNTPGTAGESTTDRFGDYNNVIFGAKGIVTQDTQEATVGFLGSYKTVTADLVSNVGTGRATLTCATACFVPTDVGAVLSDSYGFLGTGTAIISVNGAGTVATLSRNGLNGTSVNGLVVGLYVPRTVTATLTKDGATLPNTVPPNTTSKVGTLTCTASCFLTTDVGLPVYDSNINIPAGATITSVSTDSTTAKLSKTVAANLNLMNVTLLVGGARQVVVNITSTSTGVATLTCPAGCFVTTDVGLTAADINVNISAGTTIVAVDSTGKIATLSRNAVTGSTGPLTIAVGPPTGYRRPTGTASDSPYCKPSGTTPWTDPRSRSCRRPATSTRSPPPSRSTTATTRSMAPAATTSWSAATATTASRAGRAGT